MSIKKRFYFSVIANILRAGVSLLTGLIVARSLGPADYGNLAYLLGSFWAFRALLDMGASSAFYTFISRIHSSIEYYLVYFCWLLGQFLFLIILIFLVMPTYIQEKLWTNQGPHLIFLALVASYLQNQVWQTIVQIYEAKRKTVLIQIASVLIISSHLVLMIIFRTNDLISVSNILLALIVEYLVATVFLGVLIRKQRLIAKEKSQEFKSCLAEYVKFCQPMVVISAATFLFEFADKWILQNFSGPIQQGFFQVASQLSTIGLLAANSLMNILWKEVSVSHGEGNSDRVIALHKKAAGYLLLLVTCISCFFVPWSKDLIAIMLGLEYVDSWPVLLVMMFYPIHQVMGQLNNTVLMGTGNTDLHMRLTIFGLLISLPVTLFLVGKPTMFWGGGLGLGALGFALKTVLLNLCLVNLQAWCIYRKNNENYEWFSQFRGLFFCLILSTAIYWLVSELSGLTIKWQDLNVSFVFFLKLGLAGLIYVGIFLGAICVAPKLVGINPGERKELISILKQMSLLFKARS